MKYKSIFAAAALAVAPVVASAYTIDFTDNATYGTLTSPATEIFGTTGFNVGYRVIGKPGIISGSTDATLSFGQAYDGDPGATPLAEDIDGLGIDAGSAGNSDEINNAPGASVTPNSRKQAVTVAFDRAVAVTGLHFLDLFRPDPAEVPEGEDIKDFSERMQVWINRGEDFTAFQGNGDLRVRANASATDATGYRFKDVTTGSERDLFKVVNTISFTSNRNDLDELLATGGALAAIDVAPVPLPASILFLLGGLGSLAALRRRKTV